MKTFCVISHTHWDREWYMSLESFKLKLCDLFDRLLDTLEKNPEYIFHMDAQTVVLEDYLSIRPSKRALLQKYITEGRLIVGPWYLQNDFYLTSGEATVRNLLEGHQIANEFGACSKAGYAPDQFGNISQLPQILSQFGIDNFIFGRGIDAVLSDGSPLPSEFLWQGADGTQCLAIHMRYWYNNAQRFSADMDKAMRLLDVNEKNFEGIAVTPYILLMNGVDHLEAQDDLLPILADLNKRLPEDRKVRQYLMQDYINDVKQYVDENNIDMYIHKGELRQGTDWSMLKGTLSSRSQLKILNVKAQTMLENKLEPLYSILELAGADGAFSEEHFRYMWKELLKNHPHDSICGCSRDEVHTHMLDNFHRFNDTCEDMLQRGMTIAASHLDTKSANQDDYIIAVANTTQQLHSGVCEVVIDIRKDDGFDGIDIADSGGQSADYRIISKTDAVRDGFSPLNLPGNFGVDRYVIHLYAKDVQPFAIKGYAIKRAAKNHIFVPKTKDAVMENEHLKVIVSDNGHVNVLNKSSGCLYENALDIEHCTDRGDSYVHVPGETSPIYAHDFQAKVDVLSDSGLISKISITYDMVLPLYYDVDNLTPSAETAVTRVVLTLSLTKDSKHMEIGFAVDNQSKNHRLRLLVRTGVQSAHSTADIPFDIVSHTADDHNKDTKSKVFPNSTFALLQDGNRGFAVLTEGTHEYEHFEDGGILAFTMIRATGSISVDDKFRHVGGDQWSVPGNQCIGMTVGRAALYPYDGDYLNAGVISESVFFRTALQAFATSRDVRRLMQGRTAVQDSFLEEYFFVPDPYEKVIVPDNQSLLNVESKSCLVTALKKSQDGQSLVVRAVNLNKDTQSITVSANNKIICTTDLSEEEAENAVRDKACIMAGGKEIVSLKISIC